MRLLSNTLALIFGLLPLVSAAQVVDGTYRVSETWEITVMSDCESRVTTKTFRGTSTGTLIVTNDHYVLIDKTGLPISTDSLNLGRAFSLNGGSYSINGGYPVVGVSVPYVFVDLSFFLVAVNFSSEFCFSGIEPVRSETFVTRGSQLSSLSAAGVAAGVTESFRVTASSQSSLTPVGVPPPPKTPAITTQPKSQTVKAGSKATFTVKASGDAPLIYRWWKDNAPLVGATAATLTLNGITLNDAGTYAVVVSNGGGSATSQSVALTVTPPSGAGGDATPVAPTISKQPLGKTVKEGKKLKLSVKAKGTAPLGYQWFFNNISIPGATQATYELASVQPANVGAYRVVVSNSVNSVTSTSATVALQPPK